MVSGARVKFPILAGGPRPRQGGCPLTVDLPVGAGGAALDTSCCVACPCAGGGLFGLRHFLVRGWQQSSPPLYKRHQLHFNLEHWAGALDHPTISLTMLQRANVFRARLPPPRPRCPRLCHPLPTGPLPNKAPYFAAACAAWLCIHSGECFPRAYYFPAPLHHRHCTLVFHLSAGSGSHKRLACPCRTPSTAHRFACALHTPILPSLGSSVLLCLYHTHGLPRLPSFQFNEIFTGRCTIHPCSAAAFASL